jgi:hypothetical protein
MRIVTIDDADRIRSADGATAVDDRRTAARKKAITHRLIGA